MDCEQNISLSDDDFLDDLANDMMEELSTASTTTTSTNNTLQISNANAISSNTLTQTSSAHAPLPDMSDIFSKMMPMMSSMFQNNNSNNVIQPRDDSTLFSQIRAMIPPSECEEWISIIRSDEKQMKKATYHVHSRAYRSRVPQTASMKPHFLLTQLMQQTATLNKLANTPTWEAAYNDISSQKSSSALLLSFQNCLRNLIRSALCQNADFQSLSKTEPERVSHILKLLA